jgi:hypothetical protein
MSERSSINSSEEGCCGITMEQPTLLDVEDAEDAEEASSQLSGPSPPKKKTSTWWKRNLLMLAFVVLFPIIPLALSVVFGGLLALVESASFLDGFLYVASNLLNMATPLTNINPNNVIGVVIDVYVSIVALMMLGIVFNIVNHFQVALIINRQIEYVATGILVPVIALGFVIPLLMAIIAVVFGSILAAAEGWNVVDGIYYVFGNLLGLGTPLTNATPHTVMGDVLDIVISSFALGCVAVFVDYVTTLNPARYVGKRMKTFLNDNQNEDSDTHPLDNQNEGSDTGTNQAVFNP